MASRIKYRIEFAPVATRQFKKLSRDVQGRISRRIDILAERLRPDGVKKLEGAGKSVSDSDRRFPHHLYSSGQIAFDLGPDSGQAG
jgi:hypothetical protein